MVCLQEQFEAEAALSWAGWQRHKVEWKKRQRLEKSIGCKTPSNGGDSRGAPPLQSEDEAATDASLCQMMMMTILAKTKEMLSEQ